MIYLPEIITCQKSFLAVTKEGYLSQPLCWATCVPDCHDAVCNSFSLVATISITQLDKVMRDQLHEKIGR